MDEESPAEEIPPEKLEVPVPRTVIKLPTSIFVVDAFGNDEAAVDEVAMKMAAVGVEVAAMFEFEVK